MPIQSSIIKFVHGATCVWDRTTHWLYHAAMKAVPTVLLVADDVLGAADFTPFGGAVPKVPPHRWTS